MRTSRYKIFEKDDNQFQYQLIAKNGKVILTSVNYKSVEDVLGSIKKTIEFGRDMVNFDILETVTENPKDSKSYFTIIDNNDIVIATSNLYKTEQALILGCNSVMDNCHTTTISYVIGNKNG